MQVLRTYPRRRSGYPFAPDGERSVAHAYDKVIARANSLIYLEDQYLWATDVVRCFADALRRNPGLHLIAVIPLYPDQDGRLSLPPNLIGRQQALAELRAAGGARVGVYGIENHAGTPVYVHAKVCVVDDVWASVGSDNINLRSWTHDSELSCAVIDDRRDQREPRVLDRFDHGARVFARDLRLQLSREHLDRELADDAGPARPGPRLRGLRRQRPTTPTVARRRAVPDPAHPDGSGPTARRRNRSPPGSGPLRSTGPCTTRTPARDRCADPTDSEACVLHRSIIVWVSRCRS